MPTERIWAPSERPSVSSSPYQTPKAAAAGRGRAARCGVRRSDRPAVEPPEPPAEDREERQRAGDVDEGGRERDAPDPDAVEDRGEHGVQHEVPERDPVGTQGDWRLKNDRLSISIVPLNVSPSAKAASAPATTGSGRR